MRFLPAHCCAFGRWSSDWRCTTNSVTSSRDAPITITTDKLSITTTAARSGTVVMPRTNGEVMSTCARCVNGISRPYLHRPKRLGISKLCTMQCSLCWAGREQVLSPRRGRLIGAAGGRRKALNAFLILPLHRLKPIKWQFCRCWRGKTGLYYEMHSAFSSHLSLGSLGPWEWCVRSQRC